MYYSKYNRWIALWSLSIISSHNTLVCDTFLSGIYVQNSNIYTYIKQNNEVHVGNTNWNCGNRKKTSEHVAIIIEIILHVCEYVNEIFAIQLFNLDK